MTIRTVCSSVLLLLLAIVTKGLSPMQGHSSGPDDSIRIKVLNAQNGSPIAQEHLQVWLNKASDAALDVVTDQRGIAVLQISSTVETIYISSNLFYDCRSFNRNRLRPSYTIADIKKKGLVATNTCGTVNVEAEPGQLIFFVRRKHWWEGLKQ